MTFPTYDEWVANVLNPADRAGSGGTYCFETPEWYENYKIKYHIAKAINPKVIIEVGVRYGYSAHAFLAACPTARYIGIDADAAYLNAIPGSGCDWGFAMLRRTIPGFPVLELIRVNTQEVDVSTMVPWADLIHIDASHDYHSATKDIETLWPKCNQAMLVDDYVGTGSVHDAVDLFVKRNGLTMFTATSINGEALILK